MKYKTSAEAVELIQSGMRIFIHGSAASPIALINALLARAGKIKNIEFVAITTLGQIQWNEPKVKECFSWRSLFVSANVRAWVNGDGGDYVPIFLSEIPALFLQDILPVDAALIQVSPPDRHGYCSLGTSVDTAAVATKLAKIKIAQINPNMPRTFGDGHIHISEFSACTYDESPLLEVNYAREVDPCADAIGRHVAHLIHDGSTIQMGIGAVPDAVLNHLHSHKDLGVHTEMFSDGLIPLIEKGVVNNSKKKIEKGKTVTTFVAGTKKLYDFVNDHPLISFRDVSWVNDTAVIRKNPKVVAVNSALQIDLTGQVCADSIGTYQYSGIGGQMDFMRGASLSEGGKPIIALPSKTKKGISRIVPTLNLGAGVVTSRGHVHYVVTEHGVVNLYGKGLKERAKLLISIAAPDEREHLEKAYSERFMHG